MRTEVFKQESRSKTGNALLVHILKDLFPWFLPAPSVEYIHGCCVVSPDGE